MNPKKRVVAVTRKDLNNPTKMRVIGEDTLKDIQTVVGFVLGWWPGYEDAVKWDDDLSSADHPFYVAAERLDRTLCPQEK